MPKLDNEVNIDIRDQERMKKKNKNKRKQIKKKNPVQFPGLSDYLSISYLGNRKSSPN